MVSGYNSDVIEGLGRFRPAGGPGRREQRRYRRAVDLGSVATGFCASSLSSRCGHRAGRQHQPARASTRYRPAMPGTGVYFDVQERDTFRLVNARQFPCSPLLDKALIDLF